MGDADQKSSEGKKDILNILTIDHEAHEPFWESLDSDKMKFPHNDSFLFRYLGAMQIPRNYQTYTIENLQHLSYLKYNPVFRRKENIAVVADGLPYVIEERPDWYYNSSRTSENIPKPIRDFYLQEVKNGLSLIDGAIVISPLLEDYLSNIYDGSIEVCPPAISKEKVKHLQKIEPSSSPSIFSVIRGSRWKGLNLLLEAVKIARKEIEDLELNLRINKGYYRENKEKLEKDYINLYKEWYSPEEYADLFSDNMIYVQSSHFEPHGVAVAEAMCGGLKPIVTERVGAKQLFEEEFPELVRKHSAKNLAKEIINQIQLEEEKRREESNRIRSLSKQVYPENTKQKFRKKIEHLQASGENR